LLLEWRQQTSVGKEKVMAIDPAPVALAEHPLMQKVGAAVEAKVEDPRTEKNLPRTMPSPDVEQSPEVREPANWHEIQKLAKNRPGHLMQEAYQHFQQRLDSRGRGPVTTPCAVAYVALVAKEPQAGGRPLSVRDKRELETGAYVLDMLAQGKAAQAGDMMAQRLRAIEAAAGRGSWQAAQQLELLPGLDHTTPPAESVLARREQQIKTSGKEKSGSTMDSSPMDVPGAVTPGQVGCTLPRIPIGIRQEKQVASRQMRLYTR